MNFVIIGYSNDKYTAHRDDEINDSFVLPENATFFTHYIQDKKDDRGCNLCKTVMIGTLVKCVMGDVRSNIMQFEISKEEAQKNPKGVYIKYVVNGRYDYCQPNDNLTLVNNFEELKSSFIKEYEISKKSK